jgi:chemotaxis receptor (MCP) glutamine deamidase CheD
MKKQIVASGTSIIGTKKKERLEAYLGSCVGVTLVDRRADVGGLLHLLLAEATGMDISYKPESYVTTGMPHFFEKVD